MLPTILRSIARLMMVIMMVEVCAPTHHAMTQAAGRTYMHGDIRVTYNNRGAITANIPAGETSNRLMAEVGPAPIVWGRANPDGRSRGSMCPTFDACPTPVSMCA